MDFIRAARKYVRITMRVAAYGIHEMSGGRITPNMVTWFGFLMHIPIALLIAQNRLIIAAVLLVFFGLFDTLDGELARLQKRSSPAGMLLDASTDRFKEVLVYTGAAYQISVYGQASWAYIAVLACGAAICVSYIKAKGESAIATSGKTLSHTKLNRLFADGLASFDVRIFLFIIGLITNKLMFFLCVIALLSTATALFRLHRITRALSA